MKDKIRKLLGITLVGWFLLFPPAFSRTGVNLHAPLGQWPHISAYDSAFECQRALSWMLNNPITPERGAEAEAKLRATGQDVLSDAQANYRANFGECVPSDDPRLTQ